MKNVGLGEKILSTLMDIAVAFAAIAVMYMGLTENYGWGPVGDAIGTIIAVTIILAGYLAFRVGLIIRRHAGNRFYLERR